MHIWRESEGELGVRFPTGTADWEGVMLLKCAGGSDEEIREG